jgi:hypothetical protein
VLASKNLGKMPRKSKNQENSVNQFEGDEIKSQSNRSKNQRQYGGRSNNEQKTRQDLGKERNHQFMFIGESSRGQEDSLLVSIPLKTRKKGCYHWSLTSF